jgi:hypothetical protein
MYNCWNEALEYLIKSYVEQLVPLSSQKMKMARTFQTGSKMKAEDESIVLLMNQYYYGIETKKELYNKLLMIGVIKESQSSLMKIIFLFVVGLLVG